VERGEMKIKAKSWPLILIITLTLLSLLLFSPKPTNANPTTLKVLDPIQGDTSIKFNNTNPPPTAPNYPLGYVLINITVHDVTNLAAWQLNITWDHTLLEIANKALNADMYVPADNVFGAYADLVSNDITSSSAFFAVGLKISAPFSSITGSGTLCQVKFNVTKAPAENQTLNCNLHLVQANEYSIYTMLVDSNANEIPCTLEDGYYEYSWPPPPPPPPPSEGAVMAIKPPEIINSSLTPPATIQYNVTIKNVRDMYGYAFKINYDPAILGCISLQFVDILGETNYIPQFSVDNTHGLVTVNVTYIPPATPITTEEEVSAAIITYRVRGIGATLIDLNDTSLTDSLGRPIPHDSRDGLFANIIRDLAVTNVLSSSDWVYKGNKIEINVTVKNQGELVETSITVNVFCDDSVITSFTIPSLNPNGETTSTIQWDTKKVTACHQYTISAEVLTVEYEINITNNIYADGKVKVRIYGDVDGNGIVNMLDAQLIKMAIPSTPADLNWNPYADLNDDKIVNIKDYQQVKGCISHYCPS
jgi:hypothetical protein